MKRFALFIFLFCLLQGTAIVCKASHIFGGELLYTNISGNNYQVTLTLYGDCGASASIFNTLTGAAPQIYILDNTSLKDSLYLTYDATSGTEVSPVCPSQISQTTCNGGTLPGVKRFIYTGNITLGYTATNWRFVFAGSFRATSTGSVAAGRSSNITNVGANTIMEISASLNNTNGPNSSPHYSTIPTPFYCVNVLEEYNQGASDPDGDSLSFSLVPAIDANSGTSVSYNAPFTPTNPLATTGGGYLFNSLNGQMTFTPNIIQDALIVNQVSEYKKGVLVGTSEREMTFIVKDNCTGTAPSASITSLNGATLSTDASGNVVNICKGAPLVTFNITINNPDGDTTFLTSSGVPASASLTFSNNGTPYPGASFSWSTDTLSPGIYSFFLQIKNNHCPVSNTQTIAYTIHVVNFPSIREVLVDPTQCIHQAAVNYDITWGFLPRTIKIVQGGTVIKTIIDSTGSDSGAVINDSLPAGNYIAIVSSDSICSASVSFTVADSGSLTVPDTSFSFCKGDPSSMLYITPLSASASVNWYSTDGTALSSPPVVNTSFAGTYSWYFIENYKSCTSGPVNATAVVHNLPNAQVIDIPSVVCYGDKVYLKASGGTQYTWTPTDIISSDTGGQYVVVLAPLSLYVKVTDQNDCSDTTSITYSDIQRCCNMSFPTAFTPNNDGHNDGFKVVTYGNMLYFNISIFNRFGQLVFTSNDPKKEWDGTFEGIPCELGSYFYFVDAKCLTGPKKFYQGDITLIR